MNFKETESTTKLRGGYYTPPDIAAFLLRWVLQIQPERIIEPGCGDGAFFAALSDLEAKSVRSFVGFETDRPEAEKARRLAREAGLQEVEVQTRDFLSWAAVRLAGPPLFDAVVGNPPFIRYQYWDDRLEVYVHKIFDYFDLPFTKHTNAWVPFVIASLALTRPGGRLAMVVPAEILHVLHAQSIRTFLSRSCARILILDPQELWFAKTLQGAVLLLAEKKVSLDLPGEGVAITPTGNRKFLLQDPNTFFRRALYRNGAAIAGKWMPALLTQRERDILEKASSQKKIFRFAEVADVDVGIVTGANKFFLVPDAIVGDYGLQRWAFPAFGRSEHVPGVIYDDATHVENRRAGLPTNLLWFTDESEEDLPRIVRAYLRRGQAEGIPNRYKCRIREPWYSLPSVHATAVGMLKRCHTYPRLIWNQAKAFTTDTAYRIRLHRGKPPSLVFSFVNSLTALSAELEGRHYGGGVLELVPSEIEKLLVPLVEAQVTELRQLDKYIRVGLEPERLLEKQDRHVLRKVGLTTGEASELRAAWVRLRSRRQRSPIPSR